MNPDDLTSDWLNSLPNRKYFQFVNQFILTTPPGTESIDPLDRDLLMNYPHVTTDPNDMMQNIYIERPEVERDIDRFASLVILGHAGSGKSTLVWALANSQLQKAENGVLRVLLPVLQMYETGQHQSEGDAPSTLRLFRPLTEHIFNTYWETVFHNMKTRSQHLPIMRQDHDWMLQLRHFYQQLTPLRPHLNDEFELMTWLSCQQPIYQPLTQLPPVELLKQLLSFITYRSKQQTIHDPSGESFRVYSRVQVLVDELERLPLPVAESLLDDLQTCYFLGVPRLYFKIFVDASRDESISQQPWLRHGHLPVYHIPQWTAEDLQQLVTQRIVGCLKVDNSNVALGNVPRHTSEHPRQTMQREIPAWVRTIPGVCLTNQGKSVLLSKVADGARRVYDRGARYHAVDAPVHALHLARLFITLCAERWYAEPPGQPLTASDLDKCVAVYWKLKQEG